MEKLRPVWEEPESKEATEIISSGQIQLTLYRENGEKKTDANNTVILYPKTTIDQVENLENTLGNKSDKIEIVDLTRLNQGNSD